MEESLENESLVDKETQPNTAEKSIPKITAKIFISMDSVVESSTPRTNISPTQAASTLGSSPRDLRSPSLTASPRSITSPRAIDPNARRTPSPRDDNSPRDFNSPRKSGSRIIGFFEKIGSKKFSKRKSSNPPPSPRSPKESNTEAMLNLSIEQAENNTAIKSMSCPDSLSHAKARSSSLVIQKQKSFIGKGDAVISTEIQFSPRQKSLHESFSSPNPKSPTRGNSEEGSKSSLLIYCGNEIIAWCKNKDLNCQYNNICGAFIITLKNADYIQIQGYSIHANTFETETIHLFIDLIKTLPHVEKVLIYYNAVESAEIDHHITSLLTCAPEETEDSTFKFE